MEDAGQLKRALVDVSAGAISGGVSRTVTSPLDVIKIRFQVQLEPTSSRALLRKQLYETSKYTGVMQATKDIFREEGLPVYISSRVLSHIDMHPMPACGNTDEACLHIHYANPWNGGRTEDHIRLHPYLSYISGAMAGCAATIGTYPFDLLRTILASQGEPKIYSTMRSAYVDIVTMRGFSGLYAGLSPTLVEIIPYAGLQFGAYDTFKRWARVWNQRNSSRINSSQIDDSPTSFQLFLCGLAASTSSKAVCHPLDVVKKRFQIEGLRRHPKYGARVEDRAYQNMWDALQRIAYAEGFSGLYKGFFPSIIKAAPAGAVTFAAYEYTSDWLESKLT